MTNPLAAEGTLGHYLRTLRVDRHGKTLDEMAKRSGLGKAFLSDLENNVIRNLSIKSAKGIADAYITTLTKIASFI
jgi:transcriptional regulator with XRE-family HTH domain